METYRDEHLLVDLCRRIVVLDDQALPLTPKEYCLLALLVQHAGAVVPRATIVRRVWGETLEIRSRRLDIHISGLRKKLAPYANQCIETIAGIGYSFRPVPYRVLREPATLLDSEQRSTGT
jgi:DNA-binding response OmpR family regulator